MASKEKKPVEVVIFHKHKAETKKASRNPDTKQNHHKKFKKTAEDGPSKQRVFFDQRKFRYDVRKLGIHGFDKKDKETAMVDFLVELGAKPPKNKCYHIKEYQTIMKQKRDEEKKIEELERKAGIKKKKPRTTQKKVQG